MSCLYCLHLFVCGDVRHMLCCVFLHIVCPVQLISKGLFRYLRAPSWFSGPRTNVGSAWIHNCYIQNKQGQRKAWRIPSPKNLTFDLENQ
jgi:hypothetical protein